MATTQSQTTEIVDSAIGALSVTRSVVSDIDIDDFVSTTVRSQAIYLQMSNAVEKVDPRYVKGRAKVNINGTSVGGY